MTEDKQTGTRIETIHLPSPTGWPLVMAFGVTLGFAGLVTNPVISILGGVFTMAGAVGWFRQVLPQEAHEEVPVLVEAIAIESSRTRVDRFVVPEDNRAHLPLETYPILSGIKGGLAGGIAMIPPALLYGLIAAHSIWYPVNLLGGAGVANWRNPSMADIAAFHWQGLIVATVIHFVTCALVGLLYGAMLPMLPRRPILRRNHRPGLMDRPAPLNHGHRESRAGRSYRLGMVSYLADHVRPSRRPRRRSRGTDPHHPVSAFRRTHGD